MQKKDNPKPSMDKNHRRRGRPAGKNRVPLSLAERRARNAQYERERRVETAEAMAQLAEAACCDPQITNSELLVTVISQFQNVANRKTPKSIEDLKKINDNLESQIAELQSRLGSDSDLQEKNMNTDSTRSTSSQADSDSGSRSDERPTKYRKTSKEDTVHDNTRTARNNFLSDLSSDSKDSVWSNHHLGKTVPSQEASQLLPVEDTLDYIQPHTSSPHRQRSKSVSSEWRQATLSEDESSSESSNHSEVYSEQTASQQDVNVEFQLVPEQQIKSERSVDDQSNVSYMDLFTEGEKAILERLGCSDFINFQDVYCEGQPQLNWPLDYAGY